MEIELLLGMSLIANRVAEFVKRRVKDTRFASYAGDAAMVTAVVAGVVITLGGNVNVFEAATGMSDTVGQFVTGLVVGGGSEAVQIVFDVFYNRKKKTANEAGATP